MSDPFPISAPVATPDYLAALNPAQRQAVETLDGAVLVLAGAGTGKTRVLTTRLGHLLRTGRAYPSQILAVTFTNKAAMEMKKRVGLLLGDGQSAVNVEGWWLGTFHSLAARMLRRHAELVGLKSNFTILDEDDQLRLLKQLIEAENIDAKKWPPRLISSIIQRWKDRGLTPDKISAADAGAVAEGRMARIYTDYQERLQTLNACDFGDLLLHVLTIFKDPAHADVLADYQRRFKYILVDEYQDTNVSQYLWLRLLAQQNKNICCVGDDDQSIYGWRGAEIGNILKFEQDFPGAAVIRLEQNYRSTQNILSAANGVIAHNQSRLGKNLWSEQDGGEKIQIRGVWDGMQEATFVAEEIERLQHRKMPLSEMAIIVRAASQTRAFEGRFLKMGIPYRVFSGLRFYERQEIRDAIAYLRVLAQPADDLAFERIVNVPKRGIGPAAMNKVHLHARATKTSLTRALDSLLMTDEFTGKTKATLEKLLADFSRWRDSLRDLGHVEITQILLDETGYTAMWQADKSPEATGRLENLREFVSALNEFENLDMFLEHVALVMENAENMGEDFVSLMTFHAAKGLEFKAVFLPGWEEGLFPSQRSMDETGQSGLEEERRLAYVGITRARERAYISFAANRLLYGSWTSSMPSRFIDELPKDHVEVVVEGGLSAGASHGGGYQYGRQRFVTAPAIDTTFTRVSPSLESAGGFAPGQRVFHQKFGYGRIIAVDLDKLDIDFDKAGRKKVMESFVTAADAQ